MLQSFSALDFYTANIDISPALQTPRGQSLALTNVHLLQSMLIKLTSGQITVTSYNGDRIVEQGPTLLFLAKNQVLNITLEAVDHALKFSTIELSSQSVKAAYESFMNDGAYLSSAALKNTRKHLSAPLQPGVDKVFDLLQLCMNDERVENDRHDYLLRFLLSGFLDEPWALNLLRNISLNSFHEQIYRMLLKNIERPWSLQEAAAEIFMSQSTLKRRLAQENTTFSEVYLNARMNHAARLLRSDRHTITQVAYLCGYENVSYFSRVFKKHFNVTPSEFLFFMPGEILLPQ